MKSKKLASLLALCLLMVLAFSSCEKKKALDCKVTERWVVMPSTMYEFTSDSLKYTIYSTNGVFGSIADAIPNPHTWYLDGDTLVEDLGFGNVAKRHVEFACDCNVMRWTSEFQGVSYTQYLWKEGHDTATCK
jgi:hypothetical protein